VLFSAIFYLAGCSASFTAGLQLQYKKGYDIHITLNKDAAGNRGTNGSTSVFDGTNVPQIEASSHVQLSASTEPSCGLSLLSTLSRAVLALQLFQRLQQRGGGSSAPTVTHVCTDHLRSCSLAGPATLPANPAGCELPQLACRRLLPFGIAAAEAHRRLADGAACGCRRDIFLCPLPNCVFRFKRSTSRVNEFRFIPSTFPTLSPLLPV